MTALPPLPDPPPLWALAVRQPGRPGAAAPGPGAPRETGAPLWREVLAATSEPRAGIGPGALA